MPGQYFCLSSARPDRPIHVEPQFVAELDFLFLFFLNLFDGEIQAHDYLGADPNGPPDQVGRGQIDCRPEDIFLPSRHRRSADHLLWARYN